MKVAATDMSGLSFFERLSALDKPDEANDTEQIWMIIRTFLGIVRVLIFVSIIVIAEMLEEIFIANLSLAVWSLIVGIPLFVLISSLIIKTPFNLRRIYGNNPSILQNIFIKY